MFALPTLKDLMERSRQEFRANLKGTDAYIWPNNLYATAKVIAGMTFELFGFASYISRQKFAHTAPDLESLALHGTEFGIPRKPAAPALGDVVITEGAAASYAPGAIFRRSDGIEYRAVAGGSISGAGDLTLSVIGTTDGATTNTQAGTPLEIISGRTGLGTARAIVGSDGIALGVDVEDIESWRARILFRKRNPRHGGSAADYVDWAGQVSGVSFYDDRPTVYVERLYAGPGTVRIYPLMYDLYESGIPSTADVLRVADFIESVRPAGALVTVAAAQAVPVNIVISGLSPDTSEVREAVRAELRATFRRLSRVAGVDREISGMPYLAYPVSFSRSWIWQAVANASGEERHIIETPTADVALGQMQKAVLGTVQFI